MVLEGGRLSWFWERLEGLTDFRPEHPRQVLLQRIFDSIRAGVTEITFKLIQEFLDEAPLDYTCATELVRATIRGTPSALADIKEQARYQVGLL